MQVDPVRRRHRAAHAVEPFFVAVEKTRQPIRPLVADFLEQWRRIDPGVGRDCFAEQQRLGSMFFSEAAKPPKRGDPGVIVAIRMVVEEVVDAVPLDPTRIVFNEAAGNLLLGQVVKLANDAQIGARAGFARQASQDDAADDCGRGRKNSVVLAQ